MHKNAGRELRPSAFNSKDQARFWLKVAPANEVTGCRPWLASSDRRGYGHFETYRGGSTAKHRAHRVAFVLGYGKGIPAGFLVRHKCDNPACCEPAHLELGTDADNVRDAMVRGRHSRGERHGFAKLTEADVRAIRAAVGTRREIAARFSITSSNVGHIRRGVAWAHVH